MRKQSNTKRVFIFGDSIVKHVNKYDVSCKTDGAKVDVSCKTCFRDNPDNTVFHISNDGTLNKIPEIIPKLILDLPISSDMTMCAVSISHVLIRKDKHQKKHKK